MKSRILRIWRVTAALWAVLILEHWGDQDLQPVKLSMVFVLSTKPEVADARLALVDQLKVQGAQGLLAPSAALHQSVQTLPCMRVRDGSNQADELLILARVILFWCAAEQLPGWCCVSEGRPDPELLPLVRRERMLRA